MKQKVNDITKLPKWAQKKLEQLERQRDTAIKALNDYCDNETQTALYTYDVLFTGEEQGPSFKKRYIQGHKFTIEHVGIEFNILLKSDRIDLSWIGINQGDEVALIPRSHMGVDLISNDNMRIYSKKE